MNVDTQTFIELQRKSSEMIIKIVREREMRRR